MAKSAGAGKRKTNGQRRARRWTLLSMVLGKSIQTMQPPLIWVVGEPGTEDGKLLGIFGEVLAAVKLIFSTQKAERGH